MSEPTVCAWCVWMCWCGFFSTYCFCCLVRQRFLTSLLVRLVRFSWHVCKLLLLLLLFPWPLLLFFFSILMFVFVSFNIFLVVTNEQADISRCFLFTMWNYCVVRKKLESTLKYTSDECSVHVNIIRCTRQINGLSFGLTPLLLKTKFVVAWLRHKHSTWNIFTNAHLGLFRLETPFIFDGESCRIM